MSERILLVRTSALGDVLHALPALQVLRQRLPQARLGWVVEARLAPLLTGHPALDEIVTIDSPAWREEPFSFPTLEALATLRHRLRSFGATLTLDLQGLVKSAVVAWASGAPRRAGFAPPALKERAAAWLYNDAVGIPSGLHVVEKNVRLLAAAGILAAAPLTDGRHLAQASPDIRALAMQRRTPAGLVVLNPGGTRGAKMWPAEQFAELARLLTLGGAGVFVSWGPGEQPLAARVAAAGGAALAPPTSLRDLAGLLSLADLVVAGDTGPLHLAAAVGTPALALFGPTDADRNGPWGSIHRVLRAPGGDLAELAAARVSEVALSMLAEHRA